MEKRFEDKINEALKNKEPCPEQVRYPLRDGETMSAYCRIGRTVECNHKRGRIRFYEGDLCVINDQYICTYNHEAEKKKLESLSALNRVDLANLNEEQLKTLGINNYAEFIGYRMLNFLHVHAKEIIEQARNDTESEVPKVPMFDEFMERLEEECGEEHKRIYQHCRNIFYRSSLPNMMEHMPEENEK